MMTAPQRKLLLALAHANGWLPDALVYRLATYRTRRACEDSMLTPAGYRALASDAASATEAARWLDDAEWLERDG